MTALHCFNPDNDLALANGGPHYTATPRAEQLRRDLQLLPCWLAEPGSMVLCDDPALMQPWVDSKRLAVELIGRDCLPGLPSGTQFAPWGWSAAMRWRLLHWGAPPSLLPTLEQIERWRGLAHRRTTIAIHHEVTSLLGRRLCPAPMQLTTLEQVQAFAARHPGCYVKEPWSGSGRGIMRVRDPGERDFVQRATGSLRRQGSLLCEAALERTLDFALEVDCAHGLATVVGYSVFENDAHSQYASGLVASPGELRRRIAARYPGFDVVERAVLQAIERIVAPHYIGPLGIDMLLYRLPDGSEGINPCVEMNLRHTMGHVTAALGHRHGMAGQFAIKPVAQLTAADHPLTPVQDGVTRFAAVVTTS